MRIVLVRMAWVACVVTMGSCAKSARPTGPIHNDYVKFAESIVSSIERGDPSAFDSAFDFLALTERVGKELGLGEKVLENVLEGVEEQQNEASLGMGICQSVLDSSGSYRLLRLRKVGQEVSAVYRMLGDDGLNYHELFLGRTDDGRIEIVDTLFYLQGERTSDTARAMLVGVPRHTEPLPRDAELPPEVKLQALRMALQQTVERHLGEGKPEIALHVIKGILKDKDDESRSDRIILQLKITVARNVGEDEFAAAVKEFAATYPDDPSLTQLMMDVQYEAGRYGEFLKSVDDLDALVGGDTYLDALRAQAHLDMGSIDLAEQLARRVIDAHPGIRQAYSPLTGVFLEKKDYVGLARVLSEYETKTGDTLSELEDEEVYSGFVESPVYDAWIGSRQKRDSEIFDQMEAD